MNGKKAVQQRNLYLQRLNMIVELDTHFTQEEKDILKCGDVSIQLFIDTNILYYECRQEGKCCNENIVTPNRMVGIGYYYLLELKDELRTWNMGLKKQDEFSYYFWGNYGNLKEAFESL